MKILLTIIFLSLLSSPSWSESYSDLVKRNGLYYAKFTDVPFSGRVTCCLIKGSIRNGKREGAWISFWVTGQLMFKGNYKNGKKEGAFAVYHSDGSLNKKRSGMFRNGVKISN